MEKRVIWGICFMVVILLMIYLMIYGWRKARKVEIVGNINDEKGMKIEEILKIIIENYYIRILIVNYKLKKYIREVKEIKVLIKLLILERRRWKKEGDERRWEISKEVFAKEVKKKEIIEILISILKKVEGYPRWWERVQGWRVMTLTRCWIGIVVMISIRWIGRYLRYKIGKEEGKGIIWINEGISWILIWYIGINIIGVILGIWIIIRRKGEGVEWEKLVGYIWRLYMGLLGMSIIMGGMRIMEGIEIWEIWIGWKGWLVIWILIWGWLIDRRVRREIKEKRRSEKKGGGGKKEYREGNGGGAISEDREVEWKTKKNRGWS